MPRTDIFRRYPRSINNLFDYMAICDETFCVDNSTSAIVPVFEKKYGQPISINRGNSKTSAAMAKPGADWDAIRMPGEASADDSFEITSIIKRHTRFLRKVDYMSDEMKKIVACLQEAVNNEMERKAKLGYKAVILGKNGNPEVFSAKALVAGKA